MATRGVVVLWRVPITIVAVLGAVIIGVILFHIFYEPARAELLFAVQVVSYSMAVFAGYYAAVTYRMNVEHNRKQGSFAALEPLGTAEIVKTRVFIEKNVATTKVSQDRIVAKVRGDQSLYADVNTLLGFFEDISIGIQNDYYDEAVLYSSLSFMVPTYYGWLQHFVESERMAAKDVSLWNQVEKLSVAWKDKKSLLSGKPMPSSI